MFVAEIKRLDLANVTVNMAEDDAPAYSATADYNVGDEVVFGHAVYGCLMDGTTGQQPDLFSDPRQTPQRWVRKGATNAFACVDETLATPTIKDSGDLVVTIGGFSNAAGVGVFDASGGQAVARFYDASDVLLEEQSIDLSGFDYSSHWALMFRQPGGVVGNHIFELFPVASVKVELTITGPARLGEVAILSRAYDLGRVLYGTSIRIASRSVYQDDEFGQPRYIYRPSRVNVSFDLHGVKSYIHAIWGQMRSLSGRRVAYRAAEDRVILTGVGLVRDISVPVDLPNDYLFSVEIEGVQ